LTTKALLVQIGKIALSRDIPVDRSLQVIPRSLGVVPRNPITVGQAHAAVVAFLSFVQDAGRFRWIRLLEPQSLLSRHSRLSVCRQCHCGQSDLKRYTKHFLHCLSPLGTDVFAARAETAF
jgi:hypothetical protein